MKSKRVWLTGAHGLLGTAIQEVARKHYPELELLPTTRETLNYSSEEEVAQFVTNQTIQYIPSDARGSFS